MLNPLDRAIRSPQLRVHVCAIVENPRFLDTRLKAAFHPQ